MYSFSLHVNGKFDSYYNSSYMNVFKDIITVRTENSWISAKLLLRLDNLYMTWKEIKFILLQKYTGCSI